MSLLWLRFAVLLYGVAALAVLPAALYDRPRWRHVAIPAAVAAVLFHFVSLAEMLNAAHRALPVEAHETQSFLGLLLAVAFLAIYAKYRTIALGTFLLPVAFLFGLLAASHPGVEASTIPGAAQPVWLVLHIALLLTAYAALFVSLLASILYFVQERRLKSRALGPRRLRVPPLETLDRIALRALLIGFPCMTAGLLVGSVLAANTFGAAYFRDPKILLAFAMWLAYVGMIYIRRHSGLRGRRAVFLSSFVLVIILVVYASNGLSAVHRFGTP